MILLHTIKHQWNWIRIVRLALSILILFQGIQDHDWLLISMAILFGGLAIFKVNTCYTGACNTGPYRYQVNDKEIDYQEIKKGN